MKLHFSKSIVSIIAAFILSLPLFAQTSPGEKYFREGQELQKTMTIPAQKSAIKKFSTAKQLFDSKARKNDCDRAISLSNQIISQLKKGGGSNSNSNSRPVKETVVVEEKANLSLSNSKFNLGTDAKVLEVAVTTNKKEWQPAVAPCSDGNSFLEVRKNSDKTFEIIVPTNTTTLTRVQNVDVSAGGLKQTVTVSQEGRKVRLDAKKKTLKFPWKGKSEGNDISCDADQRYDDNANENWYVKSKPEWVIVTLNEKKDPNLGSKIGDGVKKGLSKLLGKSDTDKDGMIKTGIKITAQPLTPGSPEMYEGRNGVLVVASGDTLLEIHITQTPKDM